MLLNIDHVSKAYDGPNQRLVLRDVSLMLDRGQTLALTGESGSGKSTLLHLVAGLDRFDGGEITVAGQTLSSLDDTGRAALRRDHVAIVFQQFNLIQSMTVGQNLSFHARLAGREDRDWTTELTDRLGLAELTDRYPEHLSGGQQQRVAIGRALAGRPALLLADEPTGNLDETASEAVIELMLDLVRLSDTALFLVTHSRQIADRLDWHAHLSSGTIS